MVNYNIESKGGEKTNISVQIKKLRKNLNLNQTEFGKRIGAKQTTIAGYENEIRTPSDVIIKSICREFNVREEWLRNGIEPIHNEIPISIDEYARQKNMTELEKSIIMEYLDLDELTRKKVMEMLKKVFKEYLHKENNQTENEKTINMLEQEHKQKPTIIRVPARGRYYEIEETEESKAALKRDLEKKHTYNPDDF